MKKYTMVYQSELTQSIDKLLSHFRGVKIGNKIDKLDIKHFEGHIGDDDIFVQNELSYLRAFMNLQKVDMIYLDKKTV